MKEFLKKWKELIILVLIVATIITVVVVKSEDRPLKKVDISTSNHVANLTSRTYLDTILVAGLKELKIENTFIVIKTLTNTEKDFVGITYDIEGLVVNSGDQYIIYIIDTNKDKSIDILSHELIHFTQYYKKQLLIKGASVVWKDSLYDGINIKYEERPWEIDAFNRQTELKKKMISNLYFN